MNPRVLAVTILLCCGCSEPPVNDALLIENAVKAAGYEEYSVDGPYPVPDELLVVCPKGYIVNVSKSPGCPGCDTDIVLDRNGNVLAQFGGK